MSIEILCDRNIRRRLRPQVLYAHINRAPGRTPGKASRGSRKFAGGDAKAGFCRLKPHVALLRLANQAALGVH
jgi:hypothetical protein